MVRAYVRIGLGDTKIMKKEERIKGNQLILGTKQVKSKL
jgi:hypothetical protein